MKKWVYVGVLMGLFTSNALAEDIRLPEPDKTGKTTLMQALEDRHSDREFSDREVDEKTLSSILWAAYGVNRDDGKRTIPTAKDTKDLSIYVFTKNGIWLYDADNNLLKQQSDQNHMDVFQKQEYMATVPVVLVYTGSTDDYAAMHAGASYQNVGLFAAANGMANIVRGFYDREELPAILKLPKGQRVIITQAIGWKN